MQKLASRKLWFSILAVVTEVVLARQDADWKVLVAVAVTAGAYAVGQGLADRGNTIAGEVLSTLEEQNK
jgi:uncharacterized membrane protein